MFGTIRKHQTWLWGVIITLTIISFVIFFSPYSKMNTAGRRGPANYGSINGERITEEEFSDARRDVILRYFFHNGGRWPDEEARKSGFDANQEAYQWLLLLQKEAEMGIHISTEDSARLGQQLISQFERAGVTSPDIFAKQVLQSGGLQMEDFERFCRHELALEGLISIVGLSGKLITPDDVRLLYERNRQELSADIVFFSASNYQARASVSPEVISQFYTNHMAEYRIPPRVEVRYVEWPASNFLAQAETELKTNVAASVEVAFQQMGTNYLQLAKTPEEAKVKIREEFIRRAAMGEARRKADGFAAQLGEPFKAEDFDSLAKTNGLQARVSAPFSEVEFPKGLEVGPDFTKVAFSLTPEDPFARPLLGRNAVYVIAFSRKLPSENPPFEQVRERVTAECKLSQALLMAYQAGTAFHATLTNGLAQGKTFSASCLAAQLKPISLPPFSISTPEVADVADWAVMNDLKQAAFTTQVGQPSLFVWPKDKDLQRLADPGGFILFVKAKLPLDQAKLATELPIFTRNVRQRRAQEAFNLWFNKELQRGLMDTPFPARAASAQGSRS